MNSTATHAATVPPTCPVSPASAVTRDALLHLPAHRSIVSHYARNDEGVLELQLLYGDREISFDEAPLFAFGETLALQSTFRAGDAEQWGDGYPWATLRPLFEQLIEEGVLQFAAQVTPHTRRGGARPSPLSAAPAREPRSWRDCEEVFTALCGRPLAVGHLEMVVPIFRVAHFALDADGRQVGEANVFPPSLRLDAPTEWRTCPYAGSRYQEARPMNITALRAMRAWWPQMMTLLVAARSAYLARFPAARSGWTVGHVERFATLVLALVSYQVMRGHDGVAGAPLHPALSSLFRVTDGLRMVMHQMLFIPIGEPALSPDTPLDAGAIHAYAERNHSFHSEHGVCAGPTVMIEAFLRAALDGECAPEDTDADLDTTLTQALADLPAAFEYGLLGLAIYGTVFSLWPGMARAYDALAEALTPWHASPQPVRAALADWARGAREGLAHASYLASEAWRAAREHAYGDMLTACLTALEAYDGRTLATRLTPRDDESARALRRDLRARVCERCDAASGPDLAVADAVTDILVEHAVLARAVVREALPLQARINALLARPATTRPFDARDLDLHNQLLAAPTRAVPFLLDSVATLLDCQLTVDDEGLALNLPGTAVGAVAPYSNDIPSIEPRA